MKLGVNSFYNTFSKCKKSGYLNIKFLIYINNNIKLRIVIFKTLLNKREYKKMYHRNQSGESCFGFYISQTTKFIFQRTGDDI